MEYFAIEMTPKSLILGRTGQGRYFVADSDSTDENESNRLGKLLVRKTPRSPCARCSPPDSTRAIARIPAARVIGSACRTTPLQWKRRRPAPEKTEEIHGAS